MGQQRTSQLKRKGVLRGNANMARSLDPNAADITDSFWGEVPITQTAARGADHRNMESVLNFEWVGKKSVGHTSRIGAMRGKTGHTSVLPIVPVGLGSYVVRAT
jgi:hypothetical protein